MPPLGPQAVAFAVIIEKAGDGGMVDRFIAVVQHQILLADIGEVAAFAIFGEQVIEGLILGRAHLFGNRLIPFLGIREDRIDVEDHAAKAETAMLDDVADGEAGVGDTRRAGGGRLVEWKGIVPVHGFDVGRERFCARSPLGKRLSIR